MYIQKFEKENLNKKIMNNKINGIEGKRFFETNGIATLRSKADMFLSVFRDLKLR